MFKHLGNGKSDGGSQGCALKSTAKTTSAHSLDLIQAIKGRKSIQNKLSKGSKYGRKPQREKVDKRTRQRLREGGEQFGRKTNKSTQYFQKGVVWREWRSLRRSWEKYARDQGRSAKPIQNAAVNKVVVINAVILPK